jgi:putative spermidine/putrescine transport system permease protein
MERRIPVAAMWIRKRRWVLMLVPGTVLLVVFFLLPLLTLGRMAFYTYDPIRLYVPALTLENFVKVFSDQYYWSMITNSLTVGFLATLCAVFCAFPVAYYLTTAKGIERTVLTAGFLATLFITLLVTTLGWYIILLPFGVIQRLFEVLGLGSGPLRFIKTIPALVLVLAHAHLPFAVLILASSIQAIGKDKLQAARTLGASPWSIFWRITIPLTMPGIVSSAILVFTLSISAYLIPVLITGQKIPLLPIAIWTYSSEVLNWPFASAIAITLFAVTTVFTYAMILVSDLVTRRGKWKVV